MEKEYYIMIMKLKIRNMKVISPKENLKEKVFIIGMMEAITKGIF